MTEALIRRATGFEAGWNPITGLDAPPGLGIEFGVLRLRSGETHDSISDLESAYLLLSGRATLRWEQRVETVERGSLFDDEPSALHLPAGTPAVVEASGDCELAVVRTPNEERFSAELFGADNQLEREHRGKGALDDAAYRIVRTIFDRRNRPEANLVLGEVVNFPGRWSSYPPHHHPQPEIYHYRFTDPRGYGHGELGETVYKLREFDTLLITDGRDHPQTAAPGYGMWYLWAIRHLPGNPYTVPEFTAAHRWAAEPGARGWRPTTQADDIEED